MDTPLDSLVLASFAPHVNTRFRVSTAEGGAVELDLVEALSRGPDDNPFSLFFRGPSERFLPQAMYSFEHDVLGRFALFITAVGQSADGYTYEALFNRMPRGGPHRSR